MTWGDPPVVRPRPTRRFGRRPGCLLAVVAVFAVVLALAAVAHRRELRTPAELPPVTTAPATGAPVPAGTIVYDNNRTGHYELYTMPGDGGGVHQLTSTPDQDSWWGRISPDRSRILFYRTPAGTYDKDYTRTSLWVMNADGSGVTELRPEAADGWALQGHAEWAPDGRSLVMFGGKRSNPQIWVTDARGRTPRAVTERGGTNVDPSWSPDGRTVVFVGCPSALCRPVSQELYTVPAGGGTPRRLTEDSIRDNDPYYSPDGARIAWLSQTSDKGPAGVWNIRIAAADGSGVRQVTADEQVNSRPQWSADGGLLFFHRLVYGKGGFGLWQVKPDGSGLRDLTTGQPGSYGYPGT